MAHHQWSYDEALRAVQKQRSLVMPNKGFELQLRAFGAAEYNVYGAQQLLLYRRLAASVAQKLHDEPSVPALLTHLDIQALAAAGCTPSERKLQGPGSVGAPAKRPSSPATSERLPDNSSLPLQAATCSSSGGEPIARLASVRSGSAATADQTSASTSRRERRSSSSSVSSSQSSIEAAPIPRRPQRLDIELTPLELRRSTTRQPVRYTLMSGDMQAVTLLPPLMGMHWQFRCRSCDEPLFLSSSVVRPVDKATAAQWKSAVLALQGEATDQAAHEVRRSTVSTRPVTAVVNGRTLSRLPEPLPAGGYKLAGPAFSTPQPAATAQSSGDRVSRRSSGSRAESTGGDSKASTEPGRPAVKGSAGGTAGSAHDGADSSMITPRRSSWVPQRRPSTALPNLQAAELANFIALSRESPKRAAPPAAASTAAAPPAAAADEQGVEAAASVHSAGSGAFSSVRTMSTSGLNVSPSEGTAPMQHMDSLEQLEARAQRLAQRGGKRASAPGGSPARSPELARSSIVSPYTQSASKLVSAGSQMLQATSVHTASAPLLGVVGHAIPVTVKRPPLQPKNGFLVRPASGLAGASPSASPTPGASDGSSPSLTFTPSLAAAQPQRPQRARSVSTDSSPAAAALDSPSLQLMPSPQQMPAEEACPVHAWPANDVDGDDDFDAQDASAECDDDPFASMGVGLLTPSARKQPRVRAKRYQSSLSPVIDQESASPPAASDGSGPPTSSTSRALQDEGMEADSDEAPVLAAPASMPSTPAVGAGGAGFNVCPTAGGGGGRGLSKRAFTFDSAPSPSKLPSKSASTPKAGGLHTRSMSSMPLNKNVGRSGWRGVAAAEAAAEVGSFDPGDKVASVAAVMAKQGPAMLAQLRKMSTRSVTSLPDQACAPVDTKDLVPQPVPRATPQKQKPQLSAAQDLTPPAGGGGGFDWRTVTCAADTPGPATIASPSQSNPADAAAAAAAAAADAGNASVSTATDGHASSDKSMLQAPPWINDLATIVAADEDASKFVLVGDILFLEPLEWMQGMTGRTGALCCPGCAERIGFYDWVGDVRGTASPVCPALCVYSSAVWLQRPSALLQAGTSPSLTSELQARDSTPSSSKHGTHAQPQGSAASVSSHMSSSASVALSQPAGKPLRLDMTSGLAPAAPSATGDTLPEMLEQPGFAGATGSPSVALFFHASHSPVERSAAGHSLLHEDASACSQQHQQQLPQ